MVPVRTLRLAAAGMLILICSAGASMQHRTALVALNAIERGQWQLHETDGGTSKLCVTDPAALLQLHHRGAQCTQVVVENSRDVATIHYTCPGRGYGRTTISVETSKLVRIDTQGLVDGAPFDSQLEGRKLGACN
jgi:hypothetical protein